MREVVGDDEGRAALLSDFLVLWCLPCQVLEEDAWLRPSPLHAAHWNELPVADHGPGHAPDHAHQHTLLWEAPQPFLSNKVSSSSCSREGK